MNKPVWGRKLALHINEATIFVNASINFARRFRVLLFVLISIAGMLVIPFTLNTNLWGLVF